MSVNGTWTLVATPAGNATSRSISLLRQTANELKTEIINARGGKASLDARVDEDESEIQAIASWKSDNESNVSNIASIQQTANDTKAQVDILASNDSSDTRTISYIKAKAEQNESTLSGVVSWKSSVQDDVSHIATIQQTANDTKTQVDIITANNSTDTRTLAYINAKADANAGRIDTLTSYVDKTYISVDTWSATGKDVTKVYYAKDTELYWYYTSGAWASTANASTAGLPNTITNISQKADQNEADINSLTSFSGGLTTSITQLQQKSNADGGLIQSLVADIDKYSVGEYSQANGLTLAEATNIMENGMVYVPTVSHNEIYTATPNNIERSFTRTFYYIWTDNSHWVESSAGVVNFSGSYLLGATSPFWYVDSDTDVINNGITYVSHTLYKWNPDIVLPDPNAQGTAILDAGAIGGT